jgi:hypothetical protein
MLHPPSTDAMGYKFEPNLNPTKGNLKEGKLAHMDSSHVMYFQE